MKHVWLLYELIRKHTQKLIHNDLYTQTHTHTLGKKVNVNLTVREINYTILYTDSHTNNRVTHTHTDS